MTNVEQFVKKDVAQAAVGESSGPIGREEDFRLTDADEGGRGAGGGENDLRRGDAGLRG